MVHCVYIYLVIGAVGVTVWIVVCRNVVSKVGAELQRLLNV